MSFWILPKDSDLIVNPCCLYLFATRFEINQYFFSDVILKINEVRSDIAWKRLLFQSTPPSSPMNGSLVGEQGGVPHRPRIPCI